MRGAGMGWEQRGGRRYLYRNRRIDGRPVKEYLGADDRFGVGRLLAHELGAEHAAAARRRAEARAAGAALRARFDGLLAAATGANAELRAVAEGVLGALGFHRHNRGGWRMRRQLKELQDTLANLKERAAQQNPVVRYRAPHADAEAVEAFAAARTGDPEARAKVAALIRDRGWAEWLGDLGRQATAQLIRSAAGDDPVWEAGITAKATALRAELLAGGDTVLEQLLARRVLNGWVAVHALELELAVRPPARGRDREHLDRALTRAQKRLTDAARELARVRQLKAPAILAQLNVAAAQTVVNGAPAVDGASAGST